MLNIWNRNEIESGYFGEVPEENPLVSLWIIDKPNPESSGLAKDFQRQQEKTREVDTWLDAFKKVFTDAIPEMWEDIYEWFYKLWADINKITSGTVFAEAASWKQEPWIEKGLLGRIIYRWAERDKELSWRKSQREDVWWAFEALETFGQWAWFMQDIFWEVFMSGLKTLATDEQEEWVKQAITELLMTDTGQKWMKAINEWVEKFKVFEQENPKTWSLIRTMSNLGLLALDVAGFTAWKQTFNGTKRQADALVERMKTLPEKIKWIIPDLWDWAPPATISKLKESFKSVWEKISDKTFWNKIAQSVSWIDDQTKNILTEVTEQDYNRYVKIWKDAAENMKNPTPMEVAGQEVFDILWDITKKKKSVWKEMWDIVKNNSNNTVGAQERVWKYNGICVVWV